MGELIDIREQEYCFLGKGSRFKGEICLQGSTHLACHLEGNVVMDGEKTLTIDQTGSVEGNLECHDLEIFGRVKGKINSSGKVTIFPSGEVEIELHSQDLVVHPGAVANISGQAEH